MNRDRQTAATNLTPSYDYSQWPIFTVYMPSQQLSAEAFESHLIACGKPYERGERFGIIVVMGEHPPLTAVQRQASAEAMAAHNARRPGLLRGMAIVLSSPIEKGVVTAVSWVAKPPYPFESFTNVVMANAWLENLLART